MMRWLDTIIDWILDIVSPIDDEVLTGRYRTLGTRFLMTSTDREVRRMATLVREGKAPPLTESSGFMLWTPEGLAICVKTMTSAIAASVQVPLATAMQERFSAAIQAASCDAHGGAERRHRRD